MPSTRPTSSRLRRSLANGSLLLAVGLAACTTPASTTSQPAASTPQLSQPTTSQPTVVPTRPATAPSPPAPSQATAAPSTPAAGQITKLNLNTATDQQFRTIPGVGDRFVREFNEYRPYTSILQFRREIGKYVSADQVATWERYVFVPVNPNQSDADTLRQLPGVDANIASQLIASRPYASADAFVSRLGQLTSVDQAAAARQFLAS